MKNLGLAVAIVLALLVNQYSAKPAYAGDPSVLIIALAPIFIPGTLYLITGDICVLPQEWNGPRCPAANKGNAEKPKTGAFLPGNQQYVARRDTE